MTTSREVVAALLSGFEKSAAGKARKAREVRRIFAYAATMRDAAELEHPAFFQNRYEVSILRKY